MKRRDFLVTGTAGLATLTTATTVLGQQRAPGLLNRRANRSAQQEFIEVRKYTVKDADKLAQLVVLLDKALVPALNRQGLKPVGVFTPFPQDEKQKKFDRNVFVVAPHKTTESFVSVNAKLLADSVYRKDAAPIFETTSKDPVYTDCETYLLQGFPTMPGVEVPSLGPDRVFQLRLYRSFNIERNEAKIHMFDKGGELPLFREVGLNPIFFGNILAGTRMPAFLYMIGCPSLENHGETWQTFVKHPKWLAIKDLPEYKDTATEIDAIILKPSPGSQI